MTAERTCHKWLREARCKPSQTERLRKNAHSTKCPTTGSASQRRGTDNLKLLKMKFQTCVGETVSVIGTRPHLLDLHVSCSDVVSTNRSGAPVWSVVPVPLHTNRSLFVFMYQHESSLMTGDSPRGLLDPIFFLQMSERHVVCGPVSHRKWHREARRL